MNISIVKCLNQRGAVSILVIAALPVLLLFAALVLDSGSRAIAKGRLQNAADAGALAGALQMGKILSTEVSVTLAAPTDLTPTQKEKTEDAAIAAIGLNWPSSLSGSPSDCKSNCSFGEYDLSSGTFTATTTPNSNSNAFAVTLTANVPRVLFGGTIAVTATATASLTTNSLVIPTLPIGIRKASFDALACGATVTLDANGKLNEDDGCMAWTNLSTINNANADDIKGLLEKVANGQSQNLPPAKVGDLPRYTNGSLGGAFNDLNTIFNAKKIGGTWMVTVLLADIGLKNNGKCDPPNGAIKTLGFARIAVTGIDTTGKSITGKKSCSYVSEGRGGGTSTNGTTLGTIPAITH